MRKAVIDVGSNSVLLTVCEYRQGTWSPIRETSSVTGLGTGLAQGGLLLEAPMQSTLEAIKVAWETAVADGASEIIAGATMAARMAGNQSEFLERAKRQGTPVVVLTAEQEAQFGFLSVAEDPSLGEFEVVTIIDPGGHSTELATGRRAPSGAWNMEFCKSFPVGTLKLLSSELSDEVPTALDWLRASSAIDDVLGFTYRPGASGKVVTVGATGTNLVSIREGFTRWDPEKVHGALLQYEEISKAASWLGSLTLLDREAVPGIEPGRARTLPAGALILERFLHAVRAEQCLVSVRGWRYSLFSHSL